MEQWKDVVMSCATSLHAVSDSVLKSLCFFPKAWGFLWDSKSWRAITCCDLNKQQRPLLKGVGFFRAREFLETLLSGQQGAIPPQVAHVARGNTYRALAVEVKDVRGGTPDSLFSLGAWIFHPRQVGKELSYAIPTSLKQCMQLLGPVLLKQLPMELLARAGVLTRFRLKFQKRVLAQEIGEGEELDMGLGGQGPAAEAAAAAFEAEASWLPSGVDMECISIMKDHNPGAGTADMSKAARDDPARFSELSNLGEWLGMKGALTSPSLAVRLGGNKDRISLIRAVQDTYPATMKLLENSSSSAAASKLVGKVVEGCKLLDRPGDGERRADRYTPSELLLHNFYRQYLSLFSGDEGAAEDALTSHVRLVLQGCQWYAVPGARSSRAEGVVDIHIMREDLGSVRKALQDAGVTDRNTASISKAREPLLTDDEFKTRHQAMVDELETYLRINTDTCLYLLGKRYSSSTIISKRVVQPEG